MGHVFIEALNVLAETERFGVFEGRKFKDKS